MVSVNEHAFLLHSAQNLRGWGRTCIHLKEPLLVSHAAHFQHIGYRLGACQQLPGKRCRSDAALSRDTTCAHAPCRAAFSPLPQKGEQSLPLPLDSGAKARGCFGWVMQAGLAMPHALGLALWRLCHRLEKILLTGSLVP